MSTPDPFPKRIVCLTEETTEILYSIGEQDRIVGISGFTVRPPRARREKPKVSAFISAKIGEIVKLEPDLVIGFSDMQADIAAALIKCGIEVWVTNHRSVLEIIALIRRLGAMVGAYARADELARKAESHIAAIEVAAASLPHRPTVYFEEWDEPQISAIRWVAELVRIAGGADIFPELAAESLGRARIIADPDEVIRRAPEIIIGSWCGKKFRPDKVAVRTGWEHIPAVRNNDLYEIKSPIILQPGPAALFDGLDALHEIIMRVGTREPRC